MLISHFVTLFIAVGLLFGGITVVSMLAGATTTSYIPGIVGSVGYLATQLARRRRDRDDDPDGVEGFPA